MYMIAWLAKIIYIYMITVSVVINEPQAIHKRKAVMCLQIMLIQPICNIVWASQLFGIDHANISDKSI